MSWTDAPADLTSWSWSWSWRASWRKLKRETRETGQGQGPMARRSGTGTEDAGASSADAPSADVLRDEAVGVLRVIAADPEASALARVSAARALLALLASNEMPRPGSPVAKLTRSDLEAALARVLGKNAS